MLLNSDDWLPDDAINTVIKKVELNQKNIHIFISDVYEDSKKIACLEPIKEFNTPIQKMPFSHGAMIAKRNFFYKRVFIVLDIAYHQTLILLTKLIRTIMLIMMTLFIVSH